MFAITNNKGFHITFDNGWTVSVQFGWGNYCDHHGKPYDFDDLTGYYGDSSTAEIAAWDTEGVWHEFDLNTVKGYVKPNDVLDFMNMIAAKDPLATKEN